MSKLRLLSLLFVAALLSITAAACGDLEEDECDPASDANCVCTTEAGTVVTDCEEGSTADDTECSCSLVDANNPNNNPNNNPPPPNNNPNNNTPVPSYRFVLIEDLTDPVAGETPGADVDAIELIKVGGGGGFATFLEDFNIAGGNNTHADPTQMLGAPDADCVAASPAFTAMGGAAANGYVIVSFGSETTDVSIENGDSIKVYELGATLCNKFDNDPYQVSVGVGNTLGSFTESGKIIGTGGMGSNEVTVSGL